MSDPVNSEELAKVRSSNLHSEGLASVAETDMSDQYVFDDLALLQAPVSEARVPRLIEKFGGLAEARPQISGSSKATKAYIKSYHYKSSKGICDEPARMHAPIPGRLALSAQLIKTEAPTARIDMCDQEVSDVPLSSSSADAFSSEVDAKSIETLKSISKEVIKADSMEMCNFTNHEQESSPASYVDVWHGEETKTKEAVVCGQHFDRFGGDILSWEFPLTHKEKAIRCIMLQEMEITSLRKDLTEANWFDTDMLTIPKQTGLTPKKEKAQLLHSDNETSTQPMHVKTCGGCSLSAHPPTGSDDTESACPVWPRSKKEILQELADNHASLVEHLEAYHLQLRNIT